MQRSLNSLPLATLLKVIFTLLVDTGVNAMSCILNVFFHFT